MQLAQSCDDLFGHSVAKILLVLLRTEILKREHGNRSGEPAWRETIASSVSRAEKITGQKQNTCYHSGDDATPCEQESSSLASPVGRGSGSFTAAITFKCSQVCCHLGRTLVPVCGVLLQCASDDAAERFGEAGPWWRQWTRILVQNRINDRLPMVSSER